MLNIYIDTGAMHKGVTELELVGRIRTHYYPFEQRSRKVQNFVAGSGATWSQGNLSYEELPGTWEDYKISSLFQQILDIVQGHIVDAQHLDSAYKTGCSLFLTSDKTDIWSKREALFALLKLQVLHIPSEVEHLRVLAHANH